MILTEWFISRLLLIHGIGPRRTRLICNHRYSICYQILPRYIAMYLIETRNTNSANVKELPKKSGEDRDIYMFDTIQVKNMTLTV